MRKPPRLGKSSLPAPYEVGYGKPPAGTRFRKGQSGNPNGRPKGARNKLPAMNEERLKDIVLAEAYRDIKVNDGDRQVTVPMAQAVMRAIAINAAKGQHRSQKLFSDMLHRTETALRATHDQWLENAFEYKVQWERELQRRQNHGITGPEPLPHPDDIEIDMNTGKVILRGPFTKEQKAAWTWLAERRDESDEEIAGLREDLKAAPDARTRRILEEQIRHETGFRDRIVNTIGIWPNRDPMAIHQHRATKERKALIKLR